MEVPSLLRRPWKQEKGACELWPLVRLAATMTAGITLLIVGSARVDPVMIGMGGGLLAVAAKHRNDGQPGVE